MFVANPKKTPQIESILQRNKDKLLTFLKSFHNDNEGAAALMKWHVFILTPANVIDEQFSDEKQSLIVQIQAL